jgi:hypothetical protein
LEELTLKNLPLIIRGRSIGDKELEEIRALVQKYWHQGRTKISRQICYLWDWKQSNGWLKDRACRDLLLILEKKGLISLPKRKTPGAQGKKHVQSPAYLIDTSVCKGSIDYNSLTFSWIHVGKTSGSAKRGASYHYHGQPKAVFVYPLDKKFRERLHG